LYEWVEHTAELQLRIEATSEQEVFLDALAALAELIDDGTPGSPARHEVELAESDRAALLVAWLEELVFLADTDAFVPERAESLELQPEGLRAVVAGRAGRPIPLVKAVTYHDLEFAQQDGRWVATVVLDV
jgi:SHS2 domain-containing protein